MKPPEPFGAMTISTSFGLDGSLLVPVMLNEPAARPDCKSEAVTVATCTILWFGGQSEQPAPGMPEITGRLLSILIVSSTELDNPAPFMAEHVSVVPGVSAVRVV